MEKYLNKETSDEDIIKIAKLLYATLNYKYEEYFNNINNECDVSLLSLANGELRNYDK